MTLKGQGHRSKQTAPTYRLTSHYTHVVLTSHVQIAQDIFSFIERPQPKLSCVKGTIWVPESSHFNV